MASIKTVNIHDLIGREVGTSVLIKEIGRGSMGIIFLAYQRTLKRQIAVKLLPVSLLTARGAEQFHNEAESAAILSHPNIVTIYEVGETGDFLYFTMQLVKGRSVAEHIRMAGKNVLPSKRFLPLAMSLEIEKKVLDALDYAHGQDILHRDIKPANVLVESHTKRPIVTDFGLARIWHMTENTSSLIQGSPVYMAPEQIANRDVDERVDVYAAGAMLFEMLVSKLPLPPCDSVNALLKMKLDLRDQLFQKRPSEINPMVDDEMDEIVRKATSFDPNDRYPTCRKFLGALEAYSS
ncbi:MAG: serine/threonine-protein kinase [Thermodesulfobacteriota bacterium]